MPAILQQITGPLQLVGLFLLLLAGVARLIVRSPGTKLSPATSRLLVNRTFQAAIVALVLGVGLPAAAPIVQSLFVSPDETFHGAVLSTTGEPVPNAAIEVLTIGTTAANPLGQFDMTIPHNRVSRDYQVQVTAPGYNTPELMTKTDADMRHLVVTLTPQPRQLVRSFSDYLAVGQYFGAPSMLVTLHAENATASIAVITEMRASLTGPDVSLTLLPAAFTIVGPFGPFQPVSGPLPFQPGQVSDLRVMMYTGANFGSLFQQVSALPEYHAQPACSASYAGQVPPLTDAGYAIAKAFSESHFAWKAGSWHLALYVVAEGKAQTFQKDFTLSQPEVDGLRRSIALLKACQTANLNQPYAQDGEMANFVSK